MELGVSAPPQYLPGVPVPGDSLPVTTGPLLLIQSGQSATLVKGKGRCISPAGSVHPLPRVTLVFLTANVRPLREYQSHVKPGASATAEVNVAGLRALGGSSGRGRQGGMGSTAGRGHVFPGTSHFRRGCRAKPPPQGSERWAEPQTGFEAVLGCSGSRGQSWRNRWVEERPKRELQPQGCGESSKCRCGTPWLTWVPPVAEDGLWCLPWGLIPRGRA